MSFKDQIRQDLDAVFLNVDEFAELHRIEGKEIPVVVDNDQLVKQIGRASCRERV